MDQLNMKTALELVVLHNSLCKPENRIDGQWKQSKRELVLRIRALDDANTEDNVMNFPNRNSNMSIV